MKRGKNFGSCRAQVSVFIILAIVLVAGIIVFVLFKDRIFQPSIPIELEPVYSYYESCIEQAGEEGVDILGSRAGHIELTEFVPGSDFMPFSSELEFMGFGVPYWYYVSGNGIIKEQVPTKQNMEDEIQKYVETKIKDCNLDSFYAQGFEIELGEPKAEVKIEEEEINIDVSSKIIVSREELSAKKTKHNVKVNSKLGKFYEIAREIYDKEKKEAFLENYAFDVLNLYAPVDGVEISCAPKIWKTPEIAGDLLDGLEANIGAVKLKGDYYSLEEKTDEYFVVDLETDESVNMIYSQNWPSKIEIFGADEELMIAEPVGNSEGMGVMGFCYAPYHFVYDVSFPVLIQIYDNDELFQFPVVVIIDKNMPREALLSEISEAEEFELCEFKTQNIEINVYDTNLNFVDANLDYICFSQKCRLGETEDGKFEGKAPACVNGYIFARADGYAEKKQLFSSNSESVADIILDREYEVELDLKVGGGGLEGSAIVSFVGDRSVTTALPEVNKIKLSEGNYEIRVQVYGDSSIVIPATTKTRCQEVPREGLFGFFGATKEQCFEIKFPETKVEYALLGGGSSDTYLLESELEKGKMVLDVGSLPKPSSLEQLQYNYEAFENMNVGVYFE